MTIGLIGEKCGMTRVFQEDGNSVPVTVIKFNGNRIAQIKNLETDGYAAIQIAAGDKSAAKVSKSEAGHFAKAEVKPARVLKEFRISAEEMTDLKLGQEFTVELFSEGQFVDVKGVSRGKGYAGTVKRHNFRTQDATHGNSISHRAPGSIGQCQTPGRVRKGKKMSGHMGDANVTVQNQKVVEVDVERNLLLVKGNVPGAPGSLVVVVPAVKKEGKA